MLTLQYIIIGMAIGVFVTRVIKARDHGQLIASLNMTMDGAARLFVEKKALEAKVEQLEAENKNNISAGI